MKEIQNESEKKKVIRKVVMSVNREILTFLIIGKKIYYTDRKFGALVRVLPKPQQLLSFIMKSRNRIPMFIAKLFNLTKEELEEYNSAESIDQLAEIIIRDGKKNGCVLVANGDMEADETLVRKIEQSEVIL